MIVELLVTLLSSVLIPPLLLLLVLQPIGAPIVSVMNGIASFIVYPAQLITYIVGRDFLIAVFAIITAWTVVTYGYTMLFFAIRKIPFINIR